jgi:hypothetical protein
MEQIQFYLEKFKNFKLKDQDLKDEIIKIVKEKTKVNVDLKEISINNGNIRINKVGPEKSEIFIHRAEIEKELEKKVF